MDVLHWNIAFLLRTRMRTDDPTKRKNAHPQHEERIPPPRRPGSPRRPKDGDSFRIGGAGCLLSPPRRRGALSFRSLQGGRHHDASHPHSQPPRLVRLVQQRRWSRERGRWGNRSDRRVTDDEPAPVLRGVPSGPLPVRLRCGDNCHRMAARGGERRAFGGAVVFRILRRREAAYAREGRSASRPDLGTGGRTGGSASVPAGGADHPEGGPTALDVSYFVSLRRSMCPVSEKKFVVPSQRIMLPALARSSGPYLTCIVLGPPTGMSKPHCP